MQIYFLISGNVLFFCMECIASSIELLSEHFDLLKYLNFHYVVLFSGNKCDLRPNRQVLFEDACTLAEQKGALAALETSAKENHNVQEAFELMARELIVRNGGIIPQEALSDSSNIFLHSETHPIEEVEPLEKKSCDC